MKNAYTNQPNGYLESIQKGLAAVRAYDLRLSHGIGTRAERLAVQYVFDILDIPTVYADTVRSNTRSQHVLEKVGFSLIREDKEFRYYRIDKS